MNIALQLYSVRDATHADPRAALEGVAGLGYKFVELAGTYGMEYEALRSLLHGCGLSAISAHVPFDAFMAQTKSTVAKYAQLGCAMIAIPYLPIERLPGGKLYAETKAIILSAIEECKAHGIPFAYHNHAFEFTKPQGDKYLLDMFFDDIPGLQAQLDSGWITAAGESPIEYIQKYAGRLCSVHLKDTLEVSGKFEDRPLGGGSQDMPGIIDAATKAGARLLVVELDNPGNMTGLEAAGASLEYLKSKGLA